MGGEAESLPGRAMEQRCIDPRLERRDTLHACAYKRRQPAMPHRGAPPDAQRTVICSESLRQCVAAPR